MYAADLQHLRRLSCQVGKAQAAAGLGAVGAGRDRPGKQRLSEAHEPVLQSSLGAELMEADVTAIARGR